MIMKRLQASIYILFFSFLLSFTVYPAPGDDDEAGDDEYKNLTTEQSLLKAIKKYYHAHSGSEYLPYSVVFAVKGIPQVVQGILNFINSPLSQIERAGSAWGIYESVHIDMIPITTSNGAPPQKVQIGVHLSANPYSIISSNTVVRNVLSIFIDMSFSEIEPSSRNGIITSATGRPSIIQYTTTYTPFIPYLLERVIRSDNIRVRPHQIRLSFIAYFYEMLSAWGYEYHSISLSCMYQLLQIIEENIEVIYQADKIKHQSISENINNAFNPTARNCIFNNVTSNIEILPNTHTLTLNFQRNDATASLSTRYQLSLQGRDKPTDRALYFTIEYKITDNRAVLLPSQKSKFYNPGDKREPPPGASGASAAVSYLLLNTSSPIRLDMLETDLEKKGTPLLLFGF